MSLILILPFTAAQAADLSVSGGKGANLARAARQLPVPPGLIVTSAAYRAFIAPLTARVSDLLRQHGADHAACSEAIRALILAQPLPDGLIDELARALREHALADTALAVRSSGTLEDLPGAAFAGQHDTFLNVRGAPAVAEAVRACYASLWNERVLPYRERLGVGHLDAAMAVVVQGMVPVGAQETAGVAFSIDPVQGKLDQVLINAAFGLGETVVAGEAPVDEFRVARTPEGSVGTVVSRHVADKPSALVSSGAGGTRSLALDAAQRTQSALTDAQCAEVAQLALAAEQHFGFPQDIEWGYSAGRLYLLQSRAVTRVPARWTRDESAERFPNAVTPMTWDLVEEGFHTSLNYSFALMGLPHFGDKWFAMRDYYIYGNQNAVELYSGRLPIAALKDLGQLQAALPQIASQYAWVQELPLRWMRDLDTYLLGIGALMREPLDTKTLAEQWAYVLRVRDLGREYFLPNIAISLTQRMLYALLQYLLKMFTGDAQQAQTLFDRLLASTDTKTSQVNGELWALSRLIHHDARLYDALRAAPSRQFLGQLHGYPDFAKAFGQLLQRHGHRELDFDAYHPTWIEAPQTVLDQLKVLATRADEDRRGRELDVQILMADTEHALLAQAPESLRYLVREIIRLARAYTALDDLEHYQTTRLTLPFRRGLRAIGEQLVAQFVLDEREDIYFCPFAIFDAAVRAGDFAPVRTAVAQHKTGYAQARRNTPAWRHGETHEVDLNADTLQGLGGSPGTVEGEVFIVRGPENFAAFPKNAILVARTTNPAWTPLFYQAIGVITESGGPLSHGAVTARELGLPAAMSIRDATARLANGTRVRIDGTRGVVTVL
ncbi:MAG: hypothetical protein LBI48_02675 [Burkholderiaceae bacterium]|jgi:pyruvate,water dikinase|nr:hypothetical protein [Burkholderiaceae bacterium]